jgi:hypothetical protein
MVSTPQLGRKNREASHRDLLVIVVGTKETEFCFGAFRLDPFQIR